MAKVKINVDAHINHRDYKAGETVEMTAEAARRWVASGKAEAVEGVESATAAAQADKRSSVEKRG